MNITNINTSNIGHQAVDESSSHMLNKSGLNYSNTSNLDTSNVR